MARWPCRLHFKEFVGAEGEYEINKFDEAVWTWLTQRMSYVQGDLNDPETYRSLGAHLAGLDRNCGTSGNYLFYLAIADRFFCSTVAHLGEAGLTKEEGDCWRRVVIEKPFGHDLASAKHLNSEVLKSLAETSSIPHRSFPG